MTEPVGRMALAATLIIVMTVAFWAWFTTETEGWVPPGRETINQTINHGE